MPWGPLSHSSWSLPSWVHPSGIHAWCFIPKLTAATLGVTQQGCTPRAVLLGAVHWEIQESLLWSCITVIKNGVYNLMELQQQLERMRNWVRRSRKEQLQSHIHLVVEMIKTLKDFYSAIGKKLIYCLVKISTKACHNPVWVILLPSFPPREGHLPHDQERSQDLHSLGAEGSIGLNCLGKIKQVSFPAQP